MKTSLAVLVVVLGAVVSSGAENVRPAAADPFAGRGYEILTTKPFLSADFSQDVFDELWMTWEEPLRSQAEQATPEDRRVMAFSRYGLTSRPGDSSGKPQQYVVDEQGNWTMTCLACHQGKVAGKVVPGLPNTLFALQTLSDEIRVTKAAHAQANVADGSRLGRVSAGHDQRHDQRHHVRRGADGQSRRRLERHAQASAQDGPSRSRRAGLVEFQTQAPPLQRRLCRQGAAAADAVHVDSRKRTREIPRVGS